MEAISSTTCGARMFSIGREYVQSLTVELGLLGIFNVSSGAGIVSCHLFVAFDLGSFV